MPSVNCSFCDHANPADAKFCNECGAGLGLRPCAQCDAINDVAATFCHQCGALLGAPATAVASAANVEGAHAAPSSPLMRSPPSGASATDTAASLPEVGAGKTAFASPRELASAAERLDAFWRDSMQAVEVARTMKGDMTPPPPPPRGVDVLPLRVMDETPVIDAGPDTGVVLRRGPRLAIAAALLVVAAGVVYYGYERTSVRSAAPTPVATPAVIGAPTPSVVAAPTPAPVVSAAPVSAERAASDAQATTAPTVSNASAAPPADADRGAPAAAGAATSEASMPAPAVANASAPEAPLAPDASATGPADARPQAEQPTGADATAPTAAAHRASAGDSRARMRSSRAPAASRYPVPAARPILTPIPSPPVARTPELPAPSASCTDSTAALGLCRR